MTYENRGVEVEEEIKSIQYYATEFYSYAEPPNEAYRNRFSKIVKSDATLTESGKQYVLGLLRGYDV